MNSYRTEDLEKITTLEYAKKNNLWISNFQSLGDKILIGGNEHTLVLKFQNKTVYKSNNLINSRYLVTNVLEKVKIHNLLFPETRYKIIGFTGVENGKTPHIEVVLEQMYIPNLIKAEPKEIDLFMERLDFNKTTPQSYVNDTYLVFDLFPRNVLKDTDGNLYIIDAEFRDIEKLQQENTEKEVEKKEIIESLNKAMNSMNELELYKPTYLTKEHQKNSEEVLKYSKSINPSKIDWIKEVERQKTNAKD